MTTSRDILAQFENWSSDISGLSVADGDFFPRAIYEQFLSTRAADIAATRSIDPMSVNKFVEQHIGCLGVEEARVEECPCAPPSGCTWFKTPLPIPVPIGDLISVTSIGGNLEKLSHYTYRDWHVMKFTLNARIEAERTRGYYTLRNNHLYIISRTHVKAIALSGLFYDPVEVQRLPRCGEVFSDCDPFLDYPLFIDPSKYRMLLASTYEMVFGMKKAAPFDTSNNSQPPTAVEQVKP